MIFKPAFFEKREGALALPAAVAAVAHPCLSGEIFGEFWRNFSLGTSVLSVTPCDGYVFSFGGVEPLPLEGAEFSLCVSEEGIALAAKDASALKRGMMTLLDLFRAADGERGVRIFVDACHIRDRAALSFRAVHFCVFPETELWELQRFLRFAAALRYTHAVLEFWGMLQYEVMSELSWPFAFSKEKVRPILDEARELGLELIPMFNHWGHASACRVLHGKHVVLDQNPALQTYFTPDGWCFDIGKEKVRALLRRVRAELMALCGEGQYFHVGCDEAYNFEFTEENMQMICEYLGEIAAELETCGRRAIAWGDMFLSKEEYPERADYICSSPSKECAAYLRARLSKKILIADWQYNVKAAPVETSATFQREGFDTVICPWDRSVENVRAAAATAKAEGLFGVLHTTWHTLTAGMPHVMHAALGSYEAEGVREDLWARTHSAALMRRVMPAKGEYERAGWSKKQVDMIW